MSSIPLSPFDQIENPRHSTKKDLRPRNGSSLKKQPPKPPKVALKKLKIKLLFSFPKPLLQVFLSSVYDERLNVSYFQQVFESISKIGEGSYGEVYKVKSRDDGRLYAVKILKDEASGECRRNEKLAEVRNHSRIPYHRNCISLHNAWEQDNHIYLQMELGLISLDQYAECNHNIPELRVWNILLDILLALKNLHDSNFIHLDVKLQNIIVFEDGSCKLGDFGLMLDLKGDWRYATEGDAKYLAPELMHGKFTKAADVFSLGIAMLELAGDLDLPANGKLWHNLREGMLPEWLNKNLSKELLNFIKRMIQKDHKKRPSIKSLLKHPRMKSLMKQRREATENGISSLNGQITLDSVYSPRHGQENTNPRVTVSMATPPLGYSTPDMSLIFNEFDSNKSCSKTLIKDTFLATPLDEFCTKFCTTPDPQPERVNNIVITSAKKLNFVK